MINYFERSMQTWQAVLTDSTLTTSDRERYTSLYANAGNGVFKSLIKKRAPIAEIEKYAHFPLDFYQKNKDTHPYSMIHLVNLARFEELKGNKAQALSYLEEMEKISKKYETWPDTKELLSKAAKIQGRL